MKMISDELLIRHAAPTLAGLKTGNIFTCDRGEDDRALKSDLRKLNRMLGCKGIRVVPLRYTEKKAVIYVFRPGHLERDLEDLEARCILSDLGYEKEGCNNCLVRLMRKMRADGDFPHEIGLFLGYPPEDVKGFMQNRDDFICTGCWKVYADAESAVSKFAKFRKCTRVYADHYKKGSSIERLAVTS